MKDDGTIVYREWAPNAIQASLVGDFSEWHIAQFMAETAYLTSSTTDKWDKKAHPMKKNEFGVFEITIPPTADGKPAIPHNSKIKVHTPGMG